MQNRNDLRLAKCCLFEISPSNALMRHQLDSVAPTELKMVVLMKTKKELNTQLWRLVTHGRRYERAK